PLDVDADGCSRYLGLPYGTKRTPQGREVNDDRYGNECEGDQSHDGIGCFVGDKGPTEKLRGLEVESVRPARDRCPVEEHPLHRLTKSESGEREIDVSHPQR